MAKNNVDNDTDEVIIPEQARKEIKPLVILTPEEKELKELELETARLKLAYEKANLQDMQERLGERQLKREAVFERSKTNGATLSQQRKDKAQVQKRCNHHKGGNGLAGFMGGQGDNSQYAVIKHRFMNGDTWIRCQRCAKTWKPPVKSQHTSQESYDLAYREYEIALNFQTNNNTSSSYEFRYSDGGEFFRETTKDVNLH